MSTTIANSFEAVNFSAGGNIVGGGTVSGTPISSIIVGTGHTLTGTFSAILGGSANSMSGAEGITRSYMVGGTGNTITNSDGGAGTATNVGMVGCTSCTMGTTVRDRSCIINSTTVALSATGNTNTVIGCNVGTLGGTSSAGNIIAGGSSQTIDTAGASTDSAIVGGLTNSISIGLRCSIHGGNNNSISNTSSGSITNSAILSSLTGSIANSTSFNQSGNTITGGEDHNITNRVIRSSVIGGFDNNITTSGTGQIFNSSIMGGSVNSITSSSSNDSGRNTILGGTSNTITSSGTGTTTSSAILYGSGNTLTNNSSCLLGGTNATISSGASGVVCFTDSNATAFNAGTSNVFHGRFTNGYYFATNAASTSGVSLGGGNPPAPPTGATWNAISSDIRTKNIHSIIDQDAALDGIDEVKVYRYNYKDDEENMGQRIGLIAQEFNGAFAERRDVANKALSPSILLNETYGTPDDPVQTVDGDSLTYVMFSCIKALKSRVVALESTNDALQDRIAALEAQNATILNQLSGLKIKLK